MANAYVNQGISTAAKLRLVAAAVVVVLMGGTVGFMFIEDMSVLNALYMTVITLSTVGFGEVLPLHAGGRLFVIFLIIFGVAILASFATLLGEQLLEGHFKTLVTRRKMEHKLKLMSGHYIIAGFGRVGRQVAKEFRDKNVPCVVIEKSDTSVDQIISHRVLTLSGYATDDDVLINAGIERAHTLISTLPEEAQNVYLTLTARYMNPKLKIIARADFEDGEKKLLRAGADHVVIPHVLGGIRMAKAALQPHVVDFMQMASVNVEGEGLLVEEVVVPGSSFLASKSLAATQLKQNYSITVIGVKQKGRKMNINPSAETVLEAQDVVVVVGESDDLVRFSHDIGR